MWRRGSGNYVLTVYDYTGDNNDACTLSADDEVLPLTSDKTTLTNKIKNLDIAGSTAGQIGTAWAWYLLSPNWKALWPSSAALAYSPGKLQKIAVLMTDGEYNLQYDAKGIITGETGAGSAANGDLDHAGARRMRGHEEGRHHGLHRRLRPRRQQDREPTR